MNGFAQDLRWGARRLLARPAFVAVAVLTLALGIGANTAIFSLVRSVLLEPLPYAEPERLVMFWRPGEASEQTWLSQRELLEYRAVTSSFEQIAGYTDANANLTEGVEPERVRAARVTGNTFDALGVSALLGRTFTAQEDVPGHDAVVVIGYHLWQRRFAGAGDIVGSSLRINGEQRTVLGVMPPDFRLPLDYREEHSTELWIPAAIDPANPGDFGSRSFFLFARLRAGVTSEAASADLANAGRLWQQQGFINNHDGRLTRNAIPLQELLTEGVQSALLVLFAAVGLVLLIACANVANLLLARADARRREVATQVALGATRTRIVRQLLTESALLAIPGAILGAALAYAGVRGALLVTPVQLLRMRAVSIDTGVLIFTGVLALLATMIAGVVPALQLARVQPGAAMAVGGRAGTATIRRSTRHALIIAQIALSVVLVIGAGLLIRSLNELRRIDLGYDTDNLLTMRLSLPSSEYDDPARVTGFYQQLIERIEMLPGVTSAAAVRLLPLTGSIGDWSITIEGRPAAQGENPNGDWQVVTPGYFETLSIQLVRGRMLAQTDDSNAPLVALIDENMASRYWPGQDALGKRFHLGTAEQPWVTIIGITKPVRHNAAVEEARTEMFLPHAQFPREVGFAPLSMTVVTKTGGDPLALINAVRAQIRALDARLPVADIRTMDAIAATALAQPRFVTLLLSAFALLALGLAAIGIYGVVSFTAAHRTNEIGIRMALGARRDTVVRMMLIEAISIAAIGVSAGIIAAAWLTRFLANQLYRVGALDPVTFTAAPVLLIVIAGLAAWLPAQRAASTSPLIALRTD